MPITMRLAPTLVLAARASSLLLSPPTTLPTARAFSAQHSNRSSSNRSSNHKRNMSTESDQDGKPARQLVVDPFCFRQFGEHPQSGSYGGTVFSSLTVAAFEEVANARFREEDLRDGYAPFCKHVFLENDFTGDDARVNVLPVEGNEDKIRTEYAARNDKELPVLQRFIPLEAVGGAEELPRAKYLDLILYSRDQIRKENESMGNENVEGDEEAPWGIVSIKAQMEDFELPMNPITQMRNALGKDQGGSGIPLTREEYMKSVEYWTANVNVS
ncbi:unnamed protein product [Pseudo-nitzschia multistriata]|uniref:Flagellar associated protein n=1 Tax=Pseudo-nitzschia multistriata TaxID=183589 RepID=A0A448ZMK7_9STRA|nr:unnamed protein product [Pseudo-nitzschia multistriata]